MTDASVFIPKSKITRTCPDAVIRLSIVPELNWPSLRLRFYGVGKRGWCNVVCPHPLLPQREFVDVPLYRGAWAMVKNLVLQARLLEFPTEQPSTGWMALDGATYTLNTCFGEATHSLSRTMPELRVVRVINGLLNLCPVFDNYDVVRKALYCAYIEPMVSE